MLTIKQAKFVKSAASEDGLLSSVPQIVFAGKSNSGKSSLINMLTNNKKLARTGQTPGLTEFINFFEIILSNDQKVHFIDLPGYGYAKSGKTRTKDFSGLVEHYLTTSKDIKQLFLLIDIRNGATENDRQLIQFLNFHQIPFTVLATKADKLSRVRTFDHKRALASDLCLGEANIIITSNQSKQGQNDVLKIISQHLNF